MRWTPLLACVLLAMLGSCAAEQPKDAAAKTEAGQAQEGKAAKETAAKTGTDSIKEAGDKMAGEAKKTETALFGGGCFWCTEAIFQEVDGVASVTSGYAGGEVKDPTYKQVCSGDTGHAEVVQIEFDPAKASYEKLLDIFFATHDPTTLNRQGADAGTQYRSVVFYFNDAQKAAADKKIAELDKSGKFRNKIVTQVVPAATFYEAEEYHQNYYSRNPDVPYSTHVIKGKLDKFRAMTKKDE
ncbi:MAG: peptide-methionine (S)-S-oxide reductase MsrA [Planctomycetes bacterium]|nr:peptide-methionine (S)-S-oxide reductase MsrA [Planctomycetota bacterium]